MQIFKKVVLAALIAGSALSAQSAMASVAPGTPVSGTPQAGGTVDATTGAYSFGFSNTFTGDDYQGVFSDNFEVLVGTSFDSGASVTANYTSTQDLTLSSFNLLLQNADGSVSTVATGTNLTPGQKLDVWSFNTSNFAAGDYLLQVTGTVVGTAGGSYGGSINITPTSAVPEPATYGMLLGGLGLIGFAARRKKQS